MVIWPNYRIYAFEFQNAKLPCEGTCLYSWRVPLPLRLPQQWVIHLRFLATSEKWLGWVFVLKFVLLIHTYLWWNAWFWVQFRDIQSFSSTIARQVSACSFFKQMFPPTPLMALTHSLCSSILFCLVCCYFILHIQVKSYSICMLLKSAPTLGNHCRFCSCLFQSIIQHAKS